MSFSKDHFKCMIPVIILFAALSGCGIKNNTENKIKGTGSNQADTVQLMDDTELLFGDFDSLVFKYEDPERLNWQSPETVISKMGEIRGLTIADIGVGTGYFAFRLITRGANVIGIDIDQRFLDYIEERKLDQPDISAHLVTRLTTPDNPSLSENETDWILLVNTYHYLNNRVNYLKRLEKGLKAGGNLMLVDFEKVPNPVGPEEDQKISSSQAVSELRAAGFKIIEIDKSSLQYQYIIIARKI